MTMPLIWPVRGLLIGSKAWSLLGLLALAISLAVALGLGAYDALWSRWSEGGAEVFWHIRAPRVLMGVLAGAALGLSGALIQGLFRNPLADPGLIGVSGGSALGAGLAILWGGHGVLAMLGTWGLILCAFLGGLLATLLSWWLSLRQGVLSVPLLLLVGVAVNALAGSGLGLMSYLSTDQQLRALTFWLLGSLGASQWDTVSVCAVLVASAMAWILAQPSHALALNALALGEGQARLMGVPVRKIEAVCMVVVALSVGAITALTGMVGFVGLFAPHLVRLLMGPDHRHVLPGSALVGACLLLWADALSRTVVAPAELPLGVLTGMLGAPAFVWLLWRRLPPS